MTMESSTTRSTIERGQPRNLGWRNLSEGPGESHVGEVPTAQAEVVACLWHLSDFHICDAESPARLTYLDRYADPDSPYRTTLGDVGTYRPQEILTVPVAIAMVATANTESRGPLTGAPIDAVLVTGDVTDNAQHNEWSWYRTVIDGGEIAPASGGERSSWVGVSDPVTWDEHYWHPDGPPAGVEPDRPMRLHGFPRVPGLIEAARAPMHSPGLDYPVITVHGNHDALLQGTVPSDETLNAIAVGHSRITGLPCGVDPLVTARAIGMVGPVDYLVTDESPRQSVTGDSRRSILRSGDFARDLGHEHNYFRHDLGRLTILALDTVNPRGGWQGSIDPDQFHWLKHQLSQTRSNYVLITSHHPSPTMINDFRLAGDKPRILGDAVVDLLLEYPHVIGWIAGHVHFNAAISHDGPHHQFWEITTSSLIDWPQQGRIIEIVRDQGRIGIVSTVMNHASPVEWDPHAALTVESMASLSRLLAANDYQRRDEGPMNELREGSPEIRNTVWWTSDPHAQVGQASSPHAR